MDVSSFTIGKIQEEMNAGNLTAEQLVSDSIKSINDGNDDLNAMLDVSDSALAEAKEIDVRRAAGEDVGPLAGIPIAVKDNVLVRDWPSTSGSKILEGYVGSYNATIVDRLKAAGAVLIGRTNMDEMAMGSSTENSHYGPTKNPWDTTKIPGGTSGGSAAAVAAGFVPVAIGSDTGGSVRQPASLCGVVGLKPTYGRVSRYGLMAAASSLEQFGPITRNVEDAALMLQVMEGRDSKDATSVDLSNTTIPSLIDKDIKGLKIGLPKEYFLKGLDPAIASTVKTAIEELEKAGAIIEEVSLPHTEYALATFYIIQPSEASSNLGRYDGMRYGYRSSGQDLQDTYARTRGEGFGPEVKRRIMLGSYTLSSGYYDAYYRKALKVRSLIKKDFDEALKKVDVIVTPTSPSVAWNIGEKFTDPLTMYLSDIFTVTANLATVPAMSIPCGFVNDLPVGLQLMAKPFDEYSLFRVGAAYQDRTDWHLRSPNL
jgi:aspartyl-tRNA(Asn)/glutamyl-tRNA(Gln) amidotransferase subunit A